MSGTIRLHRVFRAPPERVYRAFLDPQAMAKWLPPHGFTCTVHQMDAKVGGTFRMSFTNFSNGQSHSFGGEYIALTPGEFISYTNKFDDPGLSGEIKVEVVLRTTSVGADVEIIQSGIPDVIPTEACYLGWQESLDQLAALVDPEIP